MLGLKIEKVDARFGQNYFPEASKLPVFKRDISKQEILKKFSTDISEIFCKNVLKIGIGIIEHNGCAVCSFSSTKVEVCSLCFKLVHGKMTFPFEITMKKKTGNSVGLYKTQEQCITFFF